MYKNTLKIIFTTYLTLFMINNAMANTEVELNVVCDDAINYAEIYVNGEYSAMCSAKIVVAQGEINLIVVKPVDNDHEQVFVKNLFLYKNDVINLHVVFPAPQLTFTAYRQNQTQNTEQDGAEDDARFYHPEPDIGSGFDINGHVAHWLQQAKQSEKEKLELAAEKRQYVQVLIAQARAGYLKPMRTLAELYRTGDGVDKNSELAAYWQQKVDTEVADHTLIKAKNGDLAAIEKMSQFYAKGTGVEQSDSEAQRWADEALLIKNSIAAQKKIDDIEYFQMTKGSLGVAGDAGTEMINSGEGGLLMSSISVPITTSAGLMMDMTSAPTKATQLNKLEEQISTRPSTHAKPDAMITKAAKQKSSVDK